MNVSYIKINTFFYRETIARVTGGMKVKADRDEASPYAAMLAAQVKNVVLVYLKYIHIQAAPRWYCLIVGAFMCVVNQISFFVWKCACINHFFTSEDTFYTKTCV